MFKACAIVLAFSMSVSTALAAQPEILMTSSQGKVLVSTGKGFIGATPGTALKPGAKIMVGAEASASISHGDCSITLAPGSLYTVPAKAPCAKGEVAAMPGSVMITPAAMSDFGDATPLLLIGGVAATALVATLVLTHRKKKSSPASAM